MRVRGRRHQQRCRHLRYHWQVLLTARRPVEFRHLRPCRDDRPRAFEAGWRQLVLHHRRLSLWPRLRTRPGVGKVLGAVRDPFNTVEFPGFLLQAQA
jgi:hypothetical protein